MNQFERNELVSCEGWKAINRMGALAEMHNILSRNYTDLTNHIKALSYTQPDRQEIIFDPLDYLKQYIFNFFMATAALRDNCRYVMGFYKNSNLKKEYNEKIKIFHCDLVRFVDDLRNYHAHIKPALPTVVKDKNFPPLWNIVFITADLLKTPKEWSAAAKNYVKLPGLPPGASFYSNNLIVRPISSFPCISIYFRTTFSFIPTVDARYTSDQIPSVP